jgi:hypothetical protein
MMPKTDKRFNDILNDCLERLLVKGETVDQCLAHEPEVAEALEPLLQTAATAKEAITIEPDAVFRAKARYEFRSALQEAAARKQRPISFWRLRWATVVATLLIVLSAGSGMVAAANNSMPDGPLYPIKLAVEQLQISLTSSPLDKVKLYAELSDRRVAEIIYLTGKGNVELAEVATRQLDHQLKVIASLAITLVYQEEDAVFGTLSTTPAVTKAETQAGQEPQASQGPPRLEGSQDGLGWFLEQHAASNQQALQQALESASEEVKPILEQAIEVSLAGYENVFQAAGE